MPPLISCIVPVFNGARYLREAIDSILGQTYAPIEIIVADDGSTDETPAVTKSYKERVRYEFQSNSGAPAARNLGLHACRGEFVAFLDADDLWVTDKLHLQMARFTSRPELDCCVTLVQNFWVPEVGDEEKLFANHRISAPMPGYVTQALLARRRTFEIVGEFNESLRHGDGTEWFLRAAEKGAVMDILPDVLVRRRLHRSNISRAVTASRNDYLDLLKASLNRRRQLNNGSVENYNFPTGIKVAK